MTDIIKQEVDDLRLFADPFEHFRCDPVEPEQRESEKRWVARLIRKERELALVRSPDGRVKLQPKGGTPEKFKDFRALLVSKTFANLEGLASTLRKQARLSIYDNRGVQKDFITSRVEINTGGDKDEDLSFDGVSKLLNKRDEDLRVIVIDGVAGVGKTLLIKRIVYDRSRPESYKSGNPLLLHVESLGKVLTSLDDRIAGTLDELRADFVRVELKPLIRRGLIQLAIDGFDELSDNRGYERAWGALREFLKELDGKGTCILAGRDTMLNERTVKEGLGTSIEGHSLILMTLQDPSPDDIGNWLSRDRSWSNDREALRQMRNQAQHIEYIRRPFFVSLVSNLGPDTFKESGGEPIVDLMNKMISRESRKIVPQGSSDIDSTRVEELYNEFLAEVARSMMDDETDSIELGWLAIFLEEAFTGELNREMIEAIKNRAGTLAMLEQDKDDSDLRVFPHEAIKSYFFSKSIINYFPEHGPTNALFRIPLLLESLSMFNKVVRGCKLQPQRALRAKLFEALSKNNTGYIKSNIAGLLLSFLPLENEEPEDDRRFRIGPYLELQDVWMGEHTGLQMGELSNCHISRLDVRGADFSEVRFDDVVVTELLVDNFVKFGETAPDVRRSLTLDLRHSPTAAKKGLISEFDPNKIKSWISGRSDKGAMDIVPDPRWKVLEKYARISVKQYWQRTSDDEMVRLIRSQHWEGLVELLNRYDRLRVKDHMDSSGPSKSTNWLHLVDGREFLNFREQGYPIQETTKKILQELNVPS